MKQILLGMGYLTWFCCNLAVLYGIGWGAIKLIESRSVGGFVLMLAGGMITLFLTVILSMLSLALIAMLFGDTKTTSKMSKWFPFID
mgnify:CR=1 FL=1